MHEHQTRPLTSTSEKEEAHMEHIPRPAGRTRLKRIIVALCVVTGFALLIMQAFFVRMPRYDVIAPLLSVVCGLNYLRSTRGRP